MAQFNVKPWIYHIAVVFTQLSFSTWHVLSSYALNGGADPLIFALYREFTATVCMLAYVYYAHDVSTVFNVIQAPHAFRLGFLGLCSFINVVGTIFGLKFISPTRYSLFQPLIPCIATTISIIIGIDRPTLLKICGILIAVSGALIVELWKDSNSAKERNIALGTIIVVFQVLSMACIIVFQKPLLYQYEPALLTCIYYGIGTLLTFLITLCLLYTYIPDPSLFIFQYELIPWCVLIYAVIFPTFVAYNFYSWAGKHLFPSITTMYCTLQPVFTSTLSWICLNQIITVGELLGGIVVLSGLGVTLFGEYQEYISLQGSTDISRSTSSTFKSYDKLPFSPSEVYLNEDSLIIGNSTGARVIDGEHFNKMHQEQSLS